VAQKKTRVFFDFGRETQQTPRVFSVPLQAPDVQVVWELYGFALFQNVGFGKQPRMYEEETGFKPFFHEPFPRSAESWETLGTALCGSL
jgi:hypothetical protein